MKNGVVLKKMKQRGLSLIEALVVLALLGGVVALIASRANEATQQQATQQVTAEIPQIYRGVMSRFRDEGTNGLTNTVAANLGIKPATVRGDQAAWRHEFEGQYNLTSSSASTTGAPVYDFSLEVTNVPTGDSCTTLISQNRSVGWTDIEVGTVTNIVDDWGVTDIATACDIDANERVDITFIYDPS